MNDKVLRKKTYTKGKEILHVTLEESRNKKRYSVLTFHKIKLIDFFKIKEYRFKSKESAIKKYKSINEKAKKYFSSKLNLS